MSQSGYAFAAAPKAVSGVHVAVEQPRPLGARQQPKPVGNIMYDRRVIRGSAFAKAIAKAGQIAGMGSPNAGAGGRTASGVATSTGSAFGRTGNLRSAPMSSRGAGSSRPGSTGVNPEELAEAAFRSPTPPPVEGRAHCAVQTDPFLEDLRLAKIQADFETQTAPEMDIPSEPLFNPYQSIQLPHGEPFVQRDASTMTDYAELFDFDMHVEPVLDVLCENGLEQAMVEVLEEEEMKEIYEYAQEVAHRLGTVSANLQALKQKDARLTREIENSRKHEQERLATEKMRAQDKTREIVSKQMLEEAGRAAMEELERVGYFYDAAAREVANEFLPSVLDTVRERVEVHHALASHLDRVVLEALQHAIQRNAATRTRDQTQSSPEDPSTTGVVDILGDAASVMREATAILDDPDALKGRVIPEAKQLYPHTSRRSTTPGDLLRPLSARRRPDKTVLTLTARLAQGAESASPATPFGSASDSRFGLESTSVAGTSTGETLDDLARAVEALSGAAEQSPGQLAPGAPGGDDGDGSSDDDGDGEPSHGDSKKDPDPEEKSSKEKSSLRILQSLPRWLGLKAVPARAPEVGLIVQAPEGHDSETTLPPHSSAARATLAIGDNIVSVEGHVLSTAEELDEYLAGKLPGDCISVRVRRALGASSFYAREETLVLEIGSTAMALTAIRSHRKLAGLPEYNVPLLQPIDAYHKLKQAILERGFDAKSGAELSGIVAALSGEAKLNANALVQANSSAYVITEVAKPDVHFQAYMLLQPGDLILAVNDEPCEISSTLLEEATVTSAKSELQSMAPVPGHNVVLQVLRFMPQATIEQRERVLEIVRGGASTEALLARLGGLLEVCQITDLEIELGAKEETQDTIRYWHSLVATDSNLGQRIAQRPRAPRPPPTAEELQEIARKVAREEDGANGAEAIDESELDKLGAALSAHLKADDSGSASAAQTSEDATQVDVSKSEAMLTLRSISSTFGMSTTVASAADVVVLMEKRASYFSRRALLDHARAQIAAKLATVPPTQSDQPTPLDKEVDQLIQDAIAADKAAAMSNSSKPSSGHTADDDEQHEDSMLLAAFQGKRKPQVGDSVSPPGIIVSYIDPFGAAAHATLRPGDWITHVNEERVTSPSDLTELEHMTLPGDMIHLKVIRAFDGRAEHIFLEAHGESATYNQPAIRALRNRAGLVASSSPLFTSPHVAASVVAGLQVDLGVLFEPFDDKTEAALDAEFRARLEKRRKQQQLRSSENEVSESDGSNEDDADDADDADDLDVEEEAEFLSEPMLSTTVVGIDSDSTAFFAGLSIGDTIEQIGSTLVRSSRDIMRELRRRLPGDQISIFVKRHSADSPDGVERVRLLVELPCKLRPGAAERSRELADIANSLNARARTLVPVQFVRFLRSIMTYNQHIAAVSYDSIHAGTEPQPQYAGLGAGLLWRGSYIGLKYRSPRARGSRGSRTLFSQPSGEGVSFGHTLSKQELSPSEAIAEVLSILNDESLPISTRAQTVLQRIPAWLGADIALSNAGLYVARVDPRGGAVQVGLTEGDVITHVSDIDISSPSSAEYDSEDGNSLTLPHRRVHALQDLIAQMHPGDFLKLRVLRATDCRPEAMFVELSPQEELLDTFPLERIRLLRSQAGLPSAEAQARDLVTTQSDGSPSAHIVTSLKSREIATELINRELKATLGVHGVDAATLDFGDAGPQTGLYVEKVKPDGPAARAGIAAGDMIVRVGDFTIVDIQNELHREALENSDGDSPRPLAHEVYRDIVSKFVPGSFVPIFVLPGDGDPTPQPQVIQIHEGPSEDTDASGESGVQEPKTRLQPAPVAGMPSCVWAEVHAKSSSLLGGTPSVEQLRALRNMAGMSFGLSQRASDVLTAVAKQFIKLIQSQQPAQSNWSSLDFVLEVYNRDGLAAVAASLDVLSGLIQERAVAALEKGGEAELAASNVIDPEGISDLLRLLPPSLGCEVMFVVVPDSQSGEAEVQSNDDNQLPSARYKIELQVVSVDRDGGAAQAEIIEGDYILSIDGVSVTSMTELRRLLAHRTVGDVCVVVARRASGTLVEIPIELSIDTRLIPASSNPQKTQRRPSQFAIRILRSLIGWPVAEQLRLLDASAALAELHALTPDPNIEVAVTATQSEPVLFVVGVEPGSAAEQSGVRQGDCIVAVNGVEFISLTDDEHAEEKQVANETPRNSRAERFYIAAIEALLPGDPLVLDVQPPGDSGPFTLYLPTSARTAEGVPVPQETLLSLRRIAGHGASKVLVVKKASSTEDSAPQPSTPATVRKGEEYEAKSEVADPILPFVSETGYAAVSYASNADTDDLAFSEDVTVALERESEDPNAVPASYGSALYSDPHRVTQALSHIRPDLGMTCCELDAFGKPIESQSAPEVEPGAYDPTAPHLRSLQVIALAREGGAVQATVVPGDIVLSVGGREVHTLQDLRSITSKLIPGSLVQVEVRRASDSRIESLTVEVGSTQPRSFSLLRVRALRASVNLPIPDFPVLLPSTALDALRRMKPKLGFIVSDSDQACIVRKVTPGSSAQASGLCSKDVVLSVVTDDMELRVKNTNALYRALQAYFPGDELKLRIQRKQIDPATNTIMQQEFVVGIVLGSQSATNELVQSLRTIAGLLPGQRTPLPV